MFDVNEFPSTVELWVPGTFGCWHKKDIQTKTEEPSIWKVLDETFE